MSRIFFFFAVVVVVRAKRCNHRIVTKSSQTGRAGWSCRAGFLYLLLLGVSLRCFPPCTLALRFLGVVAPVLDGRQAGRNFRLKQRSISCIFCEALCADHKHKSAHARTRTSCYFLFPIHHRDVPNWMRTDHKKKQCAIQPEESLGESIENGTIFDCYVTESSVYT